MQRETNIRAALPGDVNAMREIERAAGTLFAGIGMEDVAAHEPASPHVLLEYVVAGRAWMATIGGQPAGYALADVVDGAGHLEQVSIDPRFGRQGLGRALIDRVIRWAGNNGFHAITLLTFAACPGTDPTTRGWVSMPWTMRS